MLSEFRLPPISAIGLAKDKETGSEKNDRTTSDKIYLPNVKDPIFLPNHSAALKYLQKIRDEAHRFAIAYHKKLRGKQGLRTILEEIPGIGEVKKKALFISFGSLKNIQEASIEALSLVPTLSPKDAQTVFDFFHPRKESDG